MGTFLTARRDYMKKTLYFLCVFCALFCLSCFTAFAEETGDATEAVTEEDSETTTGTATETTTGAATEAENTEAENTDTYYIVLDAAGGVINDQEQLKLSYPKKDFQSVDLSGYAPSKEGFTFTGWYNNRTKVTSIAATDFADGTNKLHISAIYTKDSYDGSALTFTLDANGGQINEQSSATYDFDVAGKHYGVALNDYVPSRDNYEFKGWNTTPDGSGSTINVIFHHTFEKADELGMAYSDPDGTPDTRNLTFYAIWESLAAPAGQISIGDKSWNSLQSSSFDLYYNEPQQISITCGNDEASDGEASISYLISSKFLSEKALAKSSFEDYDGDISVADEGRYVIYARLTGKNGKSTYISSAGFIIDCHSPIVRGIEDGKTYCKTASITVKESHLAQVSVNDKKKKLSEDSKLTIKPADGPQTITVTDKAGNSTSFTITVNKKHVAEADDNDCTTPQLCKFCGAVVVKGKSKHTLGKWKSTGDDSHVRECTNPGCGYRVTQDCYGGQATCIKKAICKVCGSEYGSVSTTNHEALKKVDRVSATAASDGNIEYWYCSDCGKYFKDKSCSTEISEKETILKKTSPKMIGGSGSKWTKSTNDTVKFRSDAAFDDFECVLIDGKKISSSYYKVSEGSIIVELKSSYLDSLSVGSHSITIRSTTGDAVTGFSIEEKQTTEQPTTTAPITTQSTTQTTTESTTEITTEYTTEYTTTEYTTAETTTEDTTTETTTASETTTETTTQKSTAHFDSYKADNSVDKRHNRVRNLQLVILITVIVTILASFAIIILSGMKKK